MAEHRHMKVVHKASLAAGALGIPGSLAPILDVAGVAGIWGRMIVEIAKTSGHELDTDFALKLGTSVLMGVSAYVAGSKLATFALNAIPVGGTITAMGLNGYLNYIYTKRVGKAVAVIFERDEFSTRDTLRLCTAIVALVVALPSGKELV